MQLTHRKNRKWGTSAPRSQFVRLAPILPPDNLSSLSPRSLRTREYYDWIGIEREGIINAFMIARHFIRHSQHTHTHTRNLRVRFNLEDEKKRRKEAYRHSDLRRAKRNGRPAWRVTYRLAATSRGTYDSPKTDRARHLANARFRWRTPLEFVWLERIVWKEKAKVEKIINLAYVEMKHLALFVKTFKRSGRADKETSNVEYCEI